MPSRTKRNGARTVEPSQGTPDGARTDTAIQWWRRRGARTAQGRRRAAHPRRTEGERADERELILRPEIVNACMRPNVRNQQCAI